MGMTEGFGSSSGQKYLTVKNGILAEKATKDTAGAVAVTKEDQSVVYELHHKSITGYLRNVAVRTATIGGDEKEFLSINMMVKGQLYNVQCNLDSGYGFGFLSTIPAADIEGLLMISPSYTEKEGKKQSKMFLQQDAGWLKQFFTKDNPNGLPELKQVKVNGKVVWDGTDRLVFFKDMIIKLNTKLEAIWAGKVHNEIMTEGTDELPATGPVTEVKKSVKVPF